MEKEKGPPVPVFNVVLPANYGLAPPVVTQPPPAPPLEKATGLMSAFVPGLDWWAPSKMSLVAQADFAYLFKLGIGELKLFEDTQERILLSV